MTAISSPEVPPALPETRIFSTFPSRRSCSDASNRPSTKDPGRPPRTDAPKAIATGAGGAVSGAYNGPAPVTPVTTERSRPGGRTLDDATELMSTSY